MKLNEKNVLSIFDSIERRTREAEENFLSAQKENDANGTEQLVEYPLESPARMEMTEMYNTLKELNHLRLFGAAANDNYLAGGSKIVTAPILEKITNLSITALTPKSSNTLLVAGGIFAVMEGVISLITGVDYNLFIGVTILAALLDSILINGAIFETIQKIIMPDYFKKVLRHEAGHFLIAYLLGCPVEGCVLSSWDALKDPRFGGRRTGLSAGTSFFDDQLSKQVNGKMPMNRSTIDRYSAIVMGGIAAEAINYGGADGGASDEMALIRFLTQISPRGGGATAWNAEKIRNQARWGAMQAVLLIRHYKSSYEALVNVLEQGGSLGECIWAIETAAIDDKTEIRQSPQGIIVERGLFGEWIQDEEIMRKELLSVQKNTMTDLYSQDGTTIQSYNAQPLIPQMKKEKDSLTVEESEEFLKKYRDIVERKLKEIDDQIETMTKEEYTISKDNK